MPTGYTVTGGEVCVSKRRVGLSIGLGAQAAGVFKRLLKKGDLREKAAKSKPQGLKRLRKKVVWDGSSIAGWVQGLNRLLKNPPFSGDRSGFRFSSRFWSGFPW